MTAFVICFAVLALAESLLHHRQMGTLARLRGQPERVAVR